jgi:hypothetical protein
MHSNLASAGQYGIIGSATGVGNGSLARWTPGALVANNAIVGTGLNCGVYPATTSCLADVADVCRSRATTVARRARISRR